MVVGSICVGVVFGVCFEMRAQGGATLHFSLCVRLVKDSLSSVVYSSHRGGIKGVPAYREHRGQELNCKTLKMSFKLLGKM